MNRRETVWHGEEYGPSWYGSLQLKGSLLNKEDKGSCYTLDGGIGKYKVTKDSEGNSVLTGDGRYDDDDEMEFTCQELEVFLLELEVFLE